MAFGRKTMASMSFAIWLIIGSNCAFAQDSLFDFTNSDLLSDISPLSAGIVVAVCALLPLLIWQYWRIQDLTRQNLRKSTRALQIQEALNSSPDGFFCWIGQDEAMCSRRLAVLLSLARGRQASFDDVLAAMDAEGQETLAQAVRALRDHGDGFEIQLRLEDSQRQVQAQGLRIESRLGELLVDMIWFADVTEGATIIDKLSQSLTDQSARMEQLRAVFDVLPMPVWLRDEDLSLLQVNQAYATSVEIDDWQAVINDQVELAPSDMVREARALAARARAAGEPRSQNFQLVLGGERRWVKVVEIPLTLAGAKVTAGYAWDETPIAAIQAELNRLGTTQGEVLERLGTAMAIFDANTRLGFFNTAFAKLWRLEGDWLRQQPSYAELVDHLRDRRMTPETADPRADREENFRMFVSLIDPVETLMHLPDGRTLRRVVSPHPQGGLIFTYEDVTDKLALERSFNTAMAVQRESLDHLHEAIAVFGADGRLKLFNPSFCRVWRVPVWELQNQPHLAEVLENLRPAMEEAGEVNEESTASNIWAFASERILRSITERQNSTYRLERADGTVLDCASVPLPDGAMLLTWLDVTDSVKVERALLERNDALAAADVLKSEFIADVSGEVAKPLDRIMRNAQMLDDPHIGPLNHAQQECVKQITGASADLQHLVADILDLAHIEAGQVMLELDTVDVHPMLTSVAGLVRERLRQKNLTLEVNVPASVGWVVADERRMKQVIYHLLGHVLTEAGEGDVLTLEAERKSGSVVVVVRDKSTGSKSPLQMSFDHMPDSAALQAGCGLGLALVRRFVELHGGRVDMRAEESGNGYYIYLPVLE